MLLGLVACGDGGPTTLQPASGRPGDAARRVQCRLDSTSVHVTFAFDLPRGFVEGLPDSYSMEGNGCAWHRPLTVPDADDGHEGYVIVSVQARDHGLRSIQEDAEQDAVDGDSPEGDDSNLHLDYDEGVATYGATIGDQFRYLCYCDGQNNRHWYAEAAGVQMSWEAEDVLKKQIDTQFEAALVSAGSSG